MSDTRERLLRWAATAIAPDAQVVSTTALRDGGSPWRLRVEYGRDAVEVILKAGGPGQRAELATEAAALSLAAKSRLSVPELIAADIEGDDAGASAVLFSVLEGSADIPVVASPARLRALGAAAAALHTVPLTPTTDLPRRERHMPWIDFAAMRRDGVDGEATTPLMDQADEVVQAQPTPSDPTVLVHGDLWQGNTMWDGDDYVGMIDWEAAGAGSYGVDLGSLRLDTALLYGVERVDEVLRGWEEASGRDAADVGYWDLVAGLNTPADMAGFLPTIHQAGRTDLDGATLTKRRDGFLRSALSRLRA